MPGGRQPFTPVSTAPKADPRLRSATRALSAAARLSHPVPHVALEHAVYSRLVPLSRSLEIGQHGAFDPYGDLVGAIGLDELRPLPEVSVQFGNVAEVDVPVLDRRDLLGVEGLS